MNSPSLVTFAIPDVQTGREIIARLPLANPNQAAIDLCRLFDQLQAKPLACDGYFQLLEHARVAMSFIAGELSKRYLDKPLPLCDIEESLFQLVLSIWQKMAAAYAYCADMALTENRVALPDEQLAKLLQRSIHYAGMAIIEHQRARREYPHGLWRQLHRQYARAEKSGVSTIAVPDIHESHGLRIHCLATYVSVLLCDAAECYGLPLLEQTLLRRWSIYWAHLVSLQKIIPGERQPCLTVDLESDAAFQFEVNDLAPEGLRCLDTVRLATHIRHIRRSLKKQIAPLQLALGADCEAGLCLKLLKHFCRHWSQDRIERRFRRRPTSGVARLSTGFDEMHYSISGKPFEQPDNVQTYSRREFEMLFAFRHLDSPVHLPCIRQEQLRFRVDDWDAVNQSANGFCLTRGTVGRKMLLGQLLALCPHDGDRYLLAKTCWLMQTTNCGLIAGVEVLPGVPVAIAARAIEQNGQPRGKYQPAFLLPSIPAVGEEQSLVLPAGSYRTDQVFELFTDGACHVRLTQVLDGGADFERVSYVVC